MVQPTFGKIKLSISALSVLITSALLLAGCSEEAPQQVIAPTVKPALVERVSAQTGAVLSFNGVVRAAERADLSFRVSGRITDILVKEGDEVKAGQLLASLDSRDAKTALGSAELELENTSLEYKRAQAVFKKSQAISKADLDNITTRYNLALNRVDDAKRQLEYTQLIAPFDGVVGRKLVDNHIQVQANQHVLTVHDLSDLEVVINVPNRVMLEGKNNAQAVAEISSIPGQSFPLTLRSFATQADPTSQTYPVVLGLEDLNGYRVLPGMAVKVVPVVNTEATEAVNDNQQISLPITAVLPDNTGRQYVWVVGSDNKTEKRFVDVGSLNKDRIVITSNLGEGEQVIIAGVSAVIEGMEVRPYTDDRNGAQ